MMASRRKLLATDRDPALPLPTRTHELFLQATIAGKPTLEAMQDAGFKFDRTKPRWKQNTYQKASGLRNRPEFKARLRLLTAEADLRYLDKKGNRKITLLERCDAIYKRCMQIVPVRYAAHGRKVDRCECGEPIQTEFTFDSKGALKALEMMMIEEGMLVRQTNVRHGKLNFVEGSFDEIVTRFAMILARLGHDFILAINKELGYEIVPIGSVAGSDSRAGNGAGDAQQSTPELLPAPPETG
jgi:hypothetical protein